VPHSNNVGEYMLCDHTNTVVLGDRYNASLEEIAEYLDGVRI
jgi:hypothetical protein